MMNARADTERSSASAPDVVKAVVPSFRHWSGSTVKSPVGCRVWGVGFRLVVPSKQAPAAPRNLATAHP